MYSNVIITIPIFLINSINFSINSINFQFIQLFFGLSQLVVDYFSCHCLQNSTPHSTLAPSTESPFSARKQAFYKYMDENQCELCMYIYVDTIQGTCRCK